MDERFDRPGRAPEQASGLALRKVGVEPEDESRALAVRQALQRNPELFLQCDVGLVSEAWATARFSG